MTVARICGALAVAGLTLSAPAAADEPISFAGAYKVDVLRNVRGGLSRGGGAIEHLDLQWKANLENALGWKGVSAYVNFIDDRGRRVNAERVGSLAGVSNIEVPRATHRLFHAWLQKTWDDERHALLVGLYPADSEFAVMESAALFVQPPYGAWADYGMSRSPSIFNSSSFGLRYKWQGDDGLYAQAAVLDGRPGHPDHPIGTHVRFDRGDGTQAVAEIGYRPAADDDAPEGFAKLAAGYWRYSSRVPDLVDTDAAGQALGRRSDGWYVATEKTVLRGTGDANLAAFARWSFNDGDTVAVRDALNLGLRLHGMLIPDGHVLGIAWTRLATGAKFRAAQAAAGIDATRAEDSLEITYRIEPTPWLAVQPLIQRIRHPGADGAVASATLVGTRIEFAF